MVPARRGAPAARVGDRFGAYPTSVKVTIRAGYHLTAGGNGADLPVADITNNYVLAGGGAEFREEFTPLINGANGGDLVILRASVDDIPDLGDEIWTDFGGKNTLHSVETLVISNAGMANSDFVKTKLNGSEAVFIAGGAKLCTSTPGVARRCKRFAKAKSPPARWRWAGQAPGWPSSVTRSSRTRPTKTT